MAKGQRTNISKKNLVNHVLFHLNIAILIGDMFLPHSQTDPKKTHCVVAYIPITVYPRLKKKKTCKITYTSKHEKTLS